MNCHVKSLTHGLILILVGVLGFGVFARPALAIDAPIITGISLTDAMRGHTSTFYIFGKNFTAHNVKVEIFDRPECVISLWNNETIQARYVNPNTIRVAATLDYTKQAKNLSFPERTDGELQVIVSCFDKLKDGRRLFAEPFKQKAIHYFPSHNPPVVDLLAPLREDQPSVAPVVVQLDVFASFTSMMLVTLQTSSGSTDLKVVPPSDTSGPVGMTFEKEFRFILQDPNGAAIFDPTYTLVDDPVDNANPAITWVKTGQISSVDGTTLTVTAKPQAPYDPSIPIASGKLIFHVTISTPHMKQKNKSSKDGWGFEYDKK